MAKGTLKRSQSSNNVKNEHKKDKLVIQLWLIGDISQVADVYFFNVAISSNLFPDFLLLMHVIFLVTFLFSPESLTKAP